jgi:alkylated DNA nucleotide flippase Atl1
MDVRETTLQELLGGPKQYLVPLYQRPYAWEVKQRNRLWADILELAESRRTNSSATHFMGSLVLSTGAIVPSGVEFLVVDGQQRLTTLSILLCALRDYLRQHQTEQPMLAESIHEQYIADRFKPGDARLKLLPTQADRDSYRAVVDGAAGADSTSGVGSAYSFFRRALELADDPEDPRDIERIREAVLAGLSFVSITARDEDNVYRIFESLNNTGLRLTQGDLVRNYLFMRLGSRGESVYSSWWLPMQRRLSVNDLELIFWLDAVADEPLLKQGDIYSYQQARLAKMNDEQILAEIERFSRLSEQLEVIRDPSLEADPAVRKHLQHLADWASTTTVPLTLRLLSRRAAGVSSTAEVAGALATIESYIVRRTIGGRPGQGLNRTILQACGALDERPVDQVLVDYFSTGRKYFSTDDQIRDAVRTQPFYLRGLRTQQKLILKWVQEELNAKEPVDVEKSTIEHILPQTLTPDWREALEADLADDESVELVHEQLVHSLGNLTLTGYNSELSNRSFPSKREDYRKSSFSGLNQLVLGAPTWGRAQIIARGEWFAEQILRQWSGPDERLQSSDTGRDWSLVHEAIMAIPAGHWSSYGDVAALVGTHPVPLGVHLASTEVLGAHRVLQGGGTISPGFRWPDPADEREPRAVLEEEGLTFSPNGAADEGARLSTTALAERIGLVTDGFDGIDAASDGTFIGQLSSANPPASVCAVSELFDAWRGLGGTVEFGTNRESSAFMTAPRQSESGPHHWPFTIYPISGTVEVVFQHLRVRPPFDDLALRQQFRERLNAVPGIKLAESRIDKRPSFPIDVLTSESSREGVVTALQWFVDQVAPGFTHTEGDTDER